MPHAVQHIYYIETIDLKYVESGLSHIDIDKIHAILDNARKHLRIHSCEVVIRGAREYHTNVP